MGVAVYVPQPPPPLSVFLHRLPGCPQWGKLQPLTWTVGFITYPLLTTCLSPLNSQSPVGVWCFFPVLSELLALESLFQDLPPGAP